MKPTPSLAQPALAFQLDFIKAVGIILVTAFHFFGQLSGWHMKVVPTEWFTAYLGSTDPLAVPRFIVAYFYLGVNLFVIASGFGLYYSHLRSQKPFQFTTFLKKRVFKLLPAAFLAMVVLFFFKGIALGHFPVENLVLNLFPFELGLNLFSDNWFFPPIDGEMWFLGLILQLYMVFPILIKLNEKLGDRWFLVLLFGIAVFWRLEYYLVIQYSVTSMSYGFFLGRIFEFGFGMMVAKLFLGGKRPAWWWLLGLLTFWCYFFPASFPIADSLLGVGLFVGLWYVASLFSWAKKVWSFISDQSYLVFLIHHPLIWVLNAWNPVPFWSPLGVLLYIGFFGVSLVVSWLGNKLLDAISAGLAKLGARFRKSPA